MVARIFKNQLTFSWIATGLLALLPSTTTWAQSQDAFCDVCCESDAQWFAPVDFDFNCRPIRKSCGYYFNYDKLLWAATGERVTLGKKGLVVQSENIFGTSDFSIGNAPASYDIINGIQDAVPDAEFGTGDRYEFGHFKGAHGWMIGVMDGPRVVSQETYGFEGILLPNSLPLNNRFINPLDETGLPVIPPDISPSLTPIFGTGSADLSTSRNGFGSVHVNFETPEDYLLGFRDYWITPDPGESDLAAPVVGGPGRVLVVSGVTETITNNLDGSTQVLLQITGGTVVTGGDGIVDDLNGNGVAGFFAFLADIDGDGMIDEDEVVGTGIDYEDLHMFNVRFDNVFVRNVTETQGIEIMKTYEMSNRHLPVSEQNNHFSISGGVRFLSLRDSFYFEGKGGILGRTFADTRSYNQIVGPQIRGTWNKQLKKRFFMNLDGRFMFGYNIQNQKQSGAIGEDLVPGGLNSLVAAQPTAFAYSRTKNTFAPTAEFRAEGGYQLTSAIALKLGYTATYIDNITRSSQTVRWALPDMGILEGGNQGIFINGVNFGLELIH